MDPIKSFMETGIVDFGEILNGKLCSEIYSQLLNSRKWGEDIFRSKEEVSKDQQLQNTNPGKGLNNLAENLDLSFVEENPTLKHFFERILGRDFEIVLKNLVCAVPDNWIPKWLRPIVKDKIAANLGSYIKEEYRDVTYFSGLEYHLDAIDHRNELGNHLTLYVYLNDVCDGMSPIHLVEKSHYWGATTFPHCIRNVSDDVLEYGPDNDNRREFYWKSMTGKAGSTFSWSSFTLHGTYPQTSETARISLRYDLKPNSQSDSDILINQFLQQIDAPLSYSTNDNPHRIDLDSNALETGIKHQKILS